MFFSAVWQIRANFVSWFLDVVDSSQVRCWQFFPAEEACSFCWNSQALAFDLFQGYARSNLSNAWNYWNWADWSWFGMWHIWTAWNIHFAYDFAPGIGLDIPSLEMREGTRHRFEACEPEAFPMKMKQIHQHWNRSSHWFENI